MAKFVKGQSGNPAGRKPGDQTQKKLRAAIEKDLPEIVQAMVEAAKEGDTAAARLLLDKTVPSVRPVDQPIKLDVNADADLAEIGRAVLSAVASGSLPANVAQSVLAGVGTVARIAEGTELIERIEKLEEAINAQSRPS